MLKSVGTLTIRNLYHSFGTRLAGTLTYTTEKYINSSNTTVNRWRQATVDAVQAKYNNNTENDEDKARRNLIVLTTYINDSSVRTVDSYSMHSLMYAKLSSFVSK